MSIKNFIPQIWTADILRTNEDNMVARRICNTDYEGEIKQAGDTVYFNGLADPTVNDYTGTINYEDLQDAGMELKIDQQKYFAFKVGDVDKAQMKIDGKNSQSKRASYQLKKTIDTFVLGKYTDAKFTIDNGSNDAITVTTANLLSTLALGMQRLMEENVSDSQIWAVIPPWAQLKLKLAGVKFQINNGINGTGGLAWTNELGFDTFVSNQLVNLGTAQAPKHQLLMGSKNAIIFAEQILETEALRLQSSFSDAVRGLDVFGGKVVKPNELVRLNLAPGAETTI